MTTRMRSDEREAFRSFTQTQIKPFLREMEEKGETPRELIDKMGEAGLFGLPIPAEYGGRGRDYVAATLCMEELSTLAPSAAGIINVSTEIVCGDLMKHGTEEQKRKYLPDLASGKKIGAFALTEPGAGSDTAGVKTTAQLKDGKWILNGTKCFITNAEIADVFLIAALTDMGDGRRKISMFIVDKDTPGFTVGKHEDKMGIRSSSTCELILENVVIPQENLLGKLGKGISIALAGLDGGRVMIAAQGLGIAQGCWDEAVSCLKAEASAGNKRINHQWVQFRLAELAVKIEAARLLVYEAAELWSAGEDYGKEAAMAKYYATDLANEAARACMQVMGLAGAEYENRVEQFFRDAKITEIYEGTNEIQLLVIGNKLGLKA